MFEPSILPDDSRYGENPNRLQRYTQFQVIWRPDPGNSQNLFRRILSALGLRNPIRVAGLMVKEQLSGVSLLDRIPPMCAQMG